MKEGESLECVSQIIAREEEKQRVSVRNRVKRVGGV